MKGRATSQETKEEIVRLCREGLSRDAIAHHTGAGYSTCGDVIRQARKDGRLPPGKSGGRPAISQEVRDRIYRMRHEETLSLRTVAYRLSVSPAVVAKYYRLECKRRGKTPISIRPSEYKKRTKIKKPQATKPRRKRGYHAACRFCDGEVSFPVDMELDLHSRLMRASGVCDGCDQFYWMKDLLDVEALILLGLD